MKANPLSRSRIVLLLFGVFTLFLIGCSSKSSPKPDIPEIDIEALKSEAKAKHAPKVVRPRNQIAPGFEIKVTNLEDENLNGKYRVDFDGVVKLPYDVRIQTTGLTKAKLQERVAAAYRGFYKSDPGIEVRIVEKKYWVEVRGLVDKPGKYLVRQKTSLDELIGMADGLQKGKDQKHHAQ